MTELYKEYRPTEFDDVVGQQSAVDMLKGMVEKRDVPTSILFSGPSGCGKTTLARILMSKINCVGEDGVELNCADARGIDAIREIRERMYLTALFGRRRVWILDECHQLTKDAQSILLKMLEDTPAKVHFFLASTDPAKITAAIKTRCTEIKLKGVDDTTLSKLIRKTADQAKISLDQDVLVRIRDIADGSPRKALVLLDSIKFVDDADKQMVLVEAGENKAAAIDLARVLMSGGPWSKVAEMLKTMRGEEPEGIRRVVLGYCQTCILGGKNDRAAAILEGFSTNIYDTLWPGLSLICYKLCE